MDPIGLRAALFASTLFAAFPAAGVESGPFCFQSTDALGGVSDTALYFAQSASFFEIFGRIGSENFGKANIKVEGYSGAGKIYKEHEYESGAIFVAMSQLTGSSFQLKIGDYGTYVYTAVPCPD